MIDHTAIKFDLNYDTKKPDLIFCINFEKSNYNNF